MVRLGHSQVFLLGYFSCFDRCSQGGSVGMSLFALHFPALHLIPSLIFSVGQFFSLCRPYCGQVCSCSCQASGDAQFC